MLHCQPPPACQPMASLNGQSEWARHIHRACVHFFQTSCQSRPRAKAGSAAQMIYSTYVDQNAIISLSGRECKSTGRTARKPSLEMLHKLWYRYNS